MKKILLLLLIVCSAFTTAQAAEISEQKVSSKIEEVTVFLNGAQVERTARATLKPGKTELVFEKISRNMNPQSLQVGSNGAVTIVDVKHELYNENQVSVELPLAVQNQIAQLNKEIKTINSDIWYIEVERKLLKKEKNILENNALLQGKTDSLVLLKEGMSFLHQKTLEIAKSEMVLQKKLDQLNETIQSKRDRINKLTEDNTAEQNKKNQAGQFYKVVVTVSTSGTTSNEVNLTYMVSDARWVPAYDIRTDGINEPLKLAYKSRIYQNTGVDWDEVNLTVSTGNPSRNNNRPVLNPWYVKLLEPIQSTYGAYDNGLRNENMMLNTFAETNTTPGSAGNVPVQAADLAGTQVNDLNVSYELTIAHSVPSDRQWHTVKLKETDVEAEYEHHSVPKLDQAAYLLAKVKNWGSLNLLPGQANLFANGTYIGQTQINPALISEELLLSLGIDDKVGVKRYKLDSECNTALIGGKKTETYTYEIKLQNKKTETVTLSLLDQFPLAHSSSIEIELISEGGANVTPKFGKLLWDIELAPNEIKKVQFTYSVKHPGDKRVAAM